MHNLYFLSLHKLLVIPLFIYSPNIMDGSTEICSAVLVVKKSNNPNTTVNFESFERKELPWKITILDRIKQKWFRLLQKLS